MEIYTAAADRRVVLEAPITVLPGTMDVQVYDDGVLLHTATTVTADVNTNTYSFNLPFALVQYDRSLEVSWSFRYTEEGSTYEYNNVQEVNIVTPILPVSEIRTILDSDATDKEIGDIEKAVRYIIQAHTGQFFGKFMGKKRVTGSGEANLRLPSRLIRLTSVNGNIYAKQGLALRGGGWFLQNRSLIGPPSIRADFDGWNEYTAYNNAAPIVAPRSKSLGIFANNVEYEIDGIWGWDGVPPAVTEAAKLLVNDYACGDSIYRDRFITSMTAADWRIQFHEGAFSSTGNVRANQLLAEYVLRRGWTVV